MPSKSKKEDSGSFYEAYADCGRSLRAWFVAYGVGGPVLFLTQDSINQKIAASGHGRLIIYLFLIGVLLQILITAINKWANWFLYAHGDAEKPPWIYSAAAWISNQFYLDIICDIGSLVAFGWATIKALLVFV